jgi:hypothetical protein
MVQPGRRVPAWAVRRLTVLADRIVKARGDHPARWAEAVVTTRIKGLGTVTRETRCPALTTPSSCWSSMVSSNAALPPSACPEQKAAQRIRHGGLKVAASRPLQAGRSLSYM